MEEMERRLDEATGSGPRLQLNPAAADEAKAANSASGSVASDAVTAKPAASEPRAIGGCEPARRTLRPLLGRGVDPPAAGGIPVVGPQ